MKAFSRAVLLLVVLMLVTCVLQAAPSPEDNWRFKIRTDNGTGGNYNDSHFGVYPTSIDGVDSQDPSYPFDTIPPGSAVVSLCTAVINNDLTKAYVRDIRAPFGGSVTRLWDLRVGALGDAAYSNIGIKFLSFANGTPPSTLEGTSISYSLKMVNNRGVAGAPANGTVWDVPIPATYSTTIPFFTLTLPRISAGYNASDFNSMAYIMELRVGPIPEYIEPEPSGLLCLGAGLLGLVGYALRKRR